jgi:inosine-uridine nucleoside N-ribohydrolase
MGGSIAYSYDDLGFSAPTGPVPEWNIKCDVASARKLFASGVPIIMMGLDATNQLKLDETKRRLLFSHAAPLTDALTLLYFLWGKETPTLYDPMAVAMTVDASLARLTPAHIEIDDAGITRVTPGPVNARYGTQPRVDAFFDMYMQRVLSNEVSAHAAGR